MRTGSWKTYKGPGRVGISLGSPRGAPAGFRLYRKLAPTRDMLHMSLEEYAPKYQALLDALDPHQVRDELQALVGPDVEPVMMCFEVPPFTDTNFCHRRMAAAWLEEKLGIVVDEIDPKTYGQAA